MIGTQSRTRPAVAREGLGKHAVNSQDYHGGWMRILQICVHFWSSATFSLKYLYLYVFISSIFISIYLDMNCLGASMFQTHWPILMFNFVIFLKLLSCSKPDMYILYNVLACR